MKSISSNEKFQILCDNITGKLKFIAAILYILVDTGLIKFVYPTMNIIIKTKILSKSNLGI